MKIGIDASSLTKEKITGVENYVRSLISELMELESSTTFSLYSPDNFHNFRKLKPNFKLIKKSAYKYWSQLQLPKMINTDQPDVVFFPSNMVAPFVKTKIVYHFHDLAWHYFPEAYSKSVRYRQILAIKRAEKYADHIITASLSSKNDLINCYHFVPTKISVVPFGYNQSIKKYRKPLIDRQGIIFVGRLEARKNLLNILAAYENYSQTTINPEKLNLVGSPGYGFDKIQNEMNRLVAAGHKISWHNYLDDDNYHQLLGSSKLFLFPTLYEGFGLPILEAFAAGTPVISSNTSSIPEIAGDAAKLVDPSNIRAISAAITDLLNNTDTASKLIAKADKQINEFSWKRCAKKTLTILENVASQT